jgi:hypothetical protein
MPTAIANSSQQRRRDTQHSPSLKRGRPPKKAFINVLVRTSTRAALTQLKASKGLPSQGEVIDYLIEFAQERSARR